MSIRAFKKTFEKSNMWIKELTEIGSYSDAEHAYTALKAVLHTLRDRLVANEAIDLAAQLPMLIRGMYYEGWNPKKTPTVLKTAEQFIDAVEANLCQADDTIDPIEATQNVIALLCHKIDAGEMRHVESQIPNDILMLWFSQTEIS